VKQPDIDSWNKWFSRGAAEIYPYVSEFVARMKVYEAGGSKDITII